MRFPNEPSPEAGCHLVPDQLTDPSSEVMRMPYSPPIPDNVLKEVRLVRNQVSDVFGQWHLFTDLFSGQETVNMINWAFGRDAGGLIQQAIRTELAVGLGRLLDPAFQTIRGEVCHNLGINRMIHHVEVHRNAKADGMRAGFDELRELYEPLKRWRDKYHAHRDHAMALGPKPIERVDKYILSCLLGKLDRLMNRISSVLENSTLPYASACEGAAGQILAYIRPGYQASRVLLRPGEEL